MSDGKHSLFGAPSPARKTAQGRDALFSEADQRGITVECSRCGETNRSELLDTLARISWFSVWIPTKRYNRWLICPSCHQRAWVRVRWFD